MSFDPKKFEGFFHWANAAENGGPELITPEMVVTFNVRAPRTEIVRGMTVTEVADLGSLDSLMLIAQLFGCIETAAGSIRYLAAFYPDSFEVRCGEKDADDALQQLLAGLFESVQIIALGRELRTPVEDEPNRRRHALAGDLVLEANMRDALGQKNFWAALLARRPKSRSDIVFLAARHGVVL